MVATVVYVSNAESKDIHVLAMDRASGELALIEKVPVPGTDRPSPTSMPLAVSRDHRFLYAALRSEPYPASSFAICSRICRWRARLAGVGTSSSGSSALFRKAKKR